jgi:hypothetical protein
MVPNIATTTGMDERSHPSMFVRDLEQSFANIKNEGHARVLVCSIL